MPFYSRATLVLSFALLATHVSAGEIQQVSCTDGCGTDGCTSEGCDSRPGRCRVPSRRNRCNDRNCQSGNCQGNYCQQCDSGNRKNRPCNARSSAQCFALDWAGPCSPAGRMARRGNPLAKKFIWCCKTKAYPDTGWAPPAHVPLQRTGGGYGSNWSNGAAGGYGPGAPMVYMPTDTTQLGYSYRNVPTWRPNPGVIPAVPSPSNFHNRIPPQHGATYCPPSHHGYMQETMSAGCDMGYANMSQQMPAPQFAKVPAVRPAVSKPQPVLAAKPVAPKMVKVSATQPKNNVRPAKQTVRRSSTQRPGKRSTAAPKKSTGWFGLPSLSEM